jgi:hypothetical protein
MGPTVHHLQLDTLNMIIIKTSEGQFKLSGVIMCAKAYQNHSPTLKSSRESVVTLSLKDGFLALIASFSSLTLALGSMLMSKIWFHLSPQTQYHSLILSDVDIFP